MLKSALFAFALATHGAASSPEVPEMKIGARAPAPTPRPVMAPNCFDNVEGANGSVVRRYRGDRRCVQLSAPREYQGIYRNDFEGSAFFAGVTSLRAVPTLRVENQTWLNRSELLQTPAPCSPETRFQSGHSYRVRFIGRHSVVPGQGLRGYGHLGVFGNLIIVDRFLAIEDLGLRRRP
jgi:hypothetical protein